ncbi:3',5'-cyclic-nucleotide phosphodiesterase [alpha proteobacterium U9-1i]|nr:3',5'-cyclic-nucleotide phosphodiesterase [alpha proteobacterium U9-1i]
MRLVLAQISDPHIRADSEAPTLALQRALAGAKDYGAQAILLTGDLVNDEKHQEYAELARALAAPSAPLYVLPGNHDDRALIRDLLPNHTYLPRGAHLSFVIEDLPVRIVMLDQIVPHQTHGELTPELAAWLEAALAAAPDKSTLVALHHPPFATHDILFDRIGLHNQSQFADIIARHRQVQRIVCGHHHRVAFGQVAHAPAIIAPSTSWIYGLALNEGQPIAPKTHEQPGWMLHVWTPESGFVSHFIGL